MQYRGNLYFKKDVLGQKIFDSTATMTMNSESLAQLLRYEMPYGKYKGRVLADLPGHYLGWFAREGFPGGQLGALLALMYELDHNDLRSLLNPLRPPRPYPSARMPK